MLEFIVQNNRDIFFVTAFGLIALFLGIEVLIPRRPTSDQNNNRWFSNITLGVLNFYIVTWTAAIATSLSIFHWLQPSKPFLELSFLHPAVVIFMSIVFSEFVFYWSHRAFHHFPLLWRFHAIHHNDVAFDATTSYRHHPIEAIISALLHTTMVILLGAPIIALVIYNFLRITTSVFSHSNINVPGSIDRWLRLIILTPDYHRVHHSADQHFTDSNFGVAVPWFDYIFLTAKSIPVVEQETMTVGLEKWREPIDSRIDQLLLQPLTDKK